jgi:hypothetical protein
MIIIIIQGLSVTETEDLDKIFLRTVRILHQAVTRVTLLIDYVLSINTSMQIYFFKTM